jgi:hypothetical protein
VGQLQQLDAFLNVGLVGGLLHARPKMLLHRFPRAGVSRLRGQVLLFAQSEAFDLLAIARPVGRCRAYTATDGRPAVWSGRDTEREHHPPWCGPAFRGRVPSLTVFRWKAARCPSCAGR